jgi:hypothetical protein
MLLRRIVLVLAAVAAILLSLEKVDVFRIVPAGAVGFQATTERQSDGREALLLHSDVGDLSCRRIAFGRSSSPGPVASFSIAFLL